MGSISSTPSPAPTNPIQTPIASNQLPPPTASPPSTATTNSSSVQNGTNPAGPSNTPLPATSPTPIVRKAQKRKASSTIASASNTSTLKVDDQKVNDDQVAVCVKKIKEGLIDDPVAREIFEGLGVSQEFFHSGKVLAWALSPEDEQFMDIHDYIEQSQNHGFGVKILAILRIVSKADDFTDFNDDSDLMGKQRMMLWHGTRTEKVASILENGLQIPAGQGQMFGTGVYFADRVSKSAQYCAAGSGTRLPPGSVGYLFACDVVLGNVFNTKAADHTLTIPPTGYDSVKGLGNYIPDEKESKEIDGCLWPLGSTVQAKRGFFSFPYPLVFNEYAVYDANFVQPKYLVKIEFMDKPFYEKLK